MHNIYNYSFIEKKVEIYAIINKTFTLSCKLIFQATKLSFPSLIQQWKGYCNFLLTQSQSSLSHIYTLQSITIEFQYNFYDNLKKTCKNT